MSTETASVQEKRPGGRSAAVLAAVRKAVETLIVEVGRENVTIPMVADRAGVQKTSIYRRWGDLSSLMNDLATYHLDPNRPMPDSGDLANDLTAWATELVEFYRDPAHAAMLRAGASTAGDASSDCLRDRRAELTLLLAVSKSQPASTVDDILNQLVAPIVYRVIFLPDSLDDTLVPSLIRTVTLMERAAETVTHD